MRTSLVVCATLSLALGSLGVAHAQQTVQIPVDALLTARSVTTLTGGQLVTWTKGIDGGGNGNGYLTKGASTFHGDPANLIALPDDGTFAANDRHPQVVLHFSNAAASTSQQTHPVNGMGDFTFAVPSATYSKLFLFVTSAEGSSALKVTLSYGAESEVVNITVPDYFNGVSATDPVVFNLATNMAKWSNQNTVSEKDHHNLTGLELHPMAAKMLSSVKVEKAAAGYLVFWGATGVATGTVSGLGGSGAGGAAGAGGVSGNSTVGGASNGGSAGAVTGPGGNSASGSAGAAPSAGGASGAAMSVGGSATPSAGGAVASAGNATQPPTGADDSGCSCGIAGSRRSTPSLAWLALAVAMLVRRRQQKPH